MIHEIGSVAGNIWQKLSVEGEMVVTNLQKKTGIPANLFYMGLGWLAREDKIKIRREKRTIYISLKE